jgi:ATP phosphoribosyltransferase
MLLKIGMPAGSLANPNRGGNLIQLLENAGFKTSGYETGGPSKFTTINYLFGWDGRPQEFGAQLGINEIDVAIAGDDWIKERILEFKLEYNTVIKLEKVLSLKRGEVKIVGIANENEKIEDLIKKIALSRGLITVVAEMPYLALDWVQGILKRVNLFEKFSDFSVQKYKTPPRIEKGIIIYETWGKTEAKVKNGGADLGIEITQTGSAIKNYGLHIVDTIMESETGIWVNPELKADKEKNDLLKMFLLNLYGVVNAENKVMILFNVSNNLITDIEKFLSENNLFADEPTKNTGIKFTEFSVQVDVKNKNIPLAKIRYELAKRGAVNINTIPIDSSIQSIDVLGF